MSCQLKTVYSTLIVLALIVAIVLNVSEHLAC